MVKSSCIPTQVKPAFVKRGVTEIEATLDVELLFIPTNDEIFPFPEAGSPMELLLLIQL
jgi:hypothetical protein